MRTHPHALTGTFKTPFLTWINRIYLRIELTSAFFAVEFHFLFYS